MRTLKNVSNRVNTFIALFILSTLFTFNLSAHTSNIEFSTHQLQAIQFNVENDFAVSTSPFTLATPNFLSPAAPLKIKIVIIIVIKKKKKGVVEVVDMRMAEKQDIRIPLPLKDNEILAEATVKGNSFIIYPIKGRALKAGNFYGFPPSFKVPKEVSAQLMPSPMTLKASKLKALKANSLGNFEIQR